MQPSSEGEIEIISVFSCPQNEEEYSHQGEVADDDKRVVILMEKAQLDWFC